MATVVKADIGCIIGSQQVLADLVDIGGGVTVFQLKTTASGSGGAVTQGTSPWVVAGLPGALTDRSGILTLANTAQTIAAALATRRYFYIQNLSNIDSLWVNFGVAAVQSQPSLELFPGASFIMEGNFISNQLIGVVGPTTGQPWSAKEG